MTEAKPIYEMADFVCDVITPTLKAINLYSPSAEKLLTMIAAHESAGLTYRKQIGGPALGVWQMEPDTFDDIWNRYLVNVNPKRRQLALLCLHAEERENPLLALIQNDFFACAMARLKLAMVPEPLPSVTDDIGLAAYAKRYWNGPGKASAENYLSDFEYYMPRDVWPRGWS